MLEKQVESYLNKKVKESKGLSLKWISSVSGVPDRVVFLSGKIHLVELKTMTGQVSKRQKLVFAELKEQGFEVHILRSKEQIDDFINKATTP